MSGKERRRVGIMGSVKAGELSLAEASEVLGLCYQQTKRVWRRYQGEPPSAEGANIPPQPLGQFLSPQTPPLRHPLPVEKLHPALSQLLLNLRDMRAIPRLHRA